MFCASRLVFHCNQLQSRGFIACTTLHHNCHIKCQGTLQGQHYRLGPRHNIHVTTTTNTVNKTLFSKSNEGNSTTHIIYLAADYNDKDNTVILQMLYTYIYYLQLTPLCENTRPFGQYHQLNTMSPIEYRDQTQHRPVSQRPGNFFAGPVEII